MTLSTFWLVGIIGLFSLAITPARADVYTFSVDTCSGGCGNISSGTVTVTQDGTDKVKIDVEFNSNSGYGFLSTGAGGGNSFFFDILNTPTIAASFTTSGWMLASTTPGSYGHSGKGNNSLKTFDYALDCHYAGGACSGSGGSTPAPAPLIFDISATGLTPGSFKKLDTKGDAYFAADVKVLSGTGNGNTGLIGAKYTSGTVPEPTSIVLLGGVLLFTVGAIRRKAA